MDKEKEVPLKAKVLMEVLPYIKEHRGKTIVIKCGGRVLDDPEVRKGFASDVVLMRYVGINPVVVHGGAPQITQYMRKLSMDVNFLDGQRVTDEGAVEVARMVLVGKVNQELVTLINEHGTLAIGLSGADGNLITAKKQETKGGVDLGWVGDVVSINTRVIEGFLGYELVPIIATIGTDAHGNSYNINADHAAGEIAASLGAGKIIFLTDVKGILSEEGELISRLDLEGLKRMVESGEVKDGMVPKAEGCIKALEGGVERAHIIDGTFPHALLLEVFTDEGVGTMITPTPQ